LTPLFWHGDSLAPREPLAALDPHATATLTILHTNDLHASVDARTEVGGLARIASTIEAARAAGPTLVVDAGDSVYGGGTWWCAVDGGATSRLLTLAGYDLAAIGNHDLERGPRSLRELLAGGRRLVATNLMFDDEDLQRAIAPAYVVALDGGLRIGVLGLTTTMTLRLVPRSMLRGVHFVDAREATLRAVAALDSLVHTIVILSHLGFETEDFSDVHLIPALRGTGVAAILGGHTHEALDPAPVIDGICVCNAGAHGINVNQVTLGRTANGSIQVQSRLLAQNQTVPDSEPLLAARAAEVDRLRPLQDERVRLPALDGGQRELALLVAALRHSGRTAPEAVALVANLYMLNPLPASETVSHLDVLTAYPNAEQLVELELDGAQLKELIAFQAGVRFALRAEAVWLANGGPVSLSELDDATVYTLVLSELSAEGGLGWTVLQNRPADVHPLRTSCAELVWTYLRP
jgi:5'-nucleotidase